VKNEPFRTDPGSEPSKQPSGQIPKVGFEPEDLGLLPAVGRKLRTLGRKRLRIVFSRRLFFIYSVPEVQKSLPPVRERGPSIPLAKAFPSDEIGGTETRDGSREPAKQIHLPSHSQITHEIPQLSHGGVERRSNREILLSVERSLSEKVSLAGSREPTPLWKETELEKLRKEAMELRVLLAGISVQDFPILTRFLRLVSENPRTFFWYSYKDFYQGETDTPDPGEEAPLSGPDPVQGDHHGRSPASPSPGTTGELEGERR